MLGAAAVVAPDRTPAHPGLQPDRPAPQPALLLRARGRLSGALGAHRGAGGGGWLHFGPVALSGAAIFRFGALWGCTFLLVGCVEEGLFRCYGLFTLTRGINFWWALGLSCSYLR